MSHTQQRLLASLAEFMELFPSFRVGQAICNLTDRVKYPESQAKAAEMVWDIEDQELFASIEDWAEKRRAQLKERGDPPVSLADNRGEDASQKETRQKLLNALAEMSELHPEWRLGQMIANLTSWAKEPHSPEKQAEALWDIEDDELLDATAAHVARRREQLGHDRESAAR
jgi:hypothetical protein